MNARQLIKLLPDGLQGFIYKKYYAYKFKKARASQETELEVLSTLIKKGQSVADIGANYGLYTKFLSSYVGPSGKVYSFEPIRKTFKVLENNTKQFGLSNVHTFNIALSDKKGSAYMEIPQYDSGGENLYEAHISSTPSNMGEEVETNTLDNILESQKLDFIKCDVEGHELSVLKGATEQLKKNQPILMMEINSGLHDNDQATTDLLTFLTGLGYKPYVVKNGLLSVPDERHSGVNFFFLQKKHRDAMVKP